MSVAGGGGGGAAPRGALAPLDERRKFFIANCSYEWTPAEIRAFFEQFGAVNHVRMFPDRSNNGDRRAVSGGGGWERGRGKRGTAPTHLLMLRQLELGRGCRGTGSTSSASRGASSGASSRSPDGSGLR